MNIGYLPLEHLHRAVDRTVPSMRWNGKQDIGEWQKAAREKLKELIGLDEIKKYDVPLTYEIEYDRICEDIGCREIRFRFATEEDVTVPCHLLIPRDADKPLPTVIALQGHSTGMHISLGRPRYERDENSIKGGDRDFAVRAVKEGICAVTLEQRCFGECGGTPDGPDCRQSAMRALLVGRTLIGERVWDVMKLIDLLEREFQALVDTDTLLCMGNSGGGTTTVYASAMDERIKVSVPSCSVARYADSIAGVRHCECNFVPHIAHFFDMGDLGAMVAPRPQIVVTGTTDRIFPVDSAKECVAESRKVYEALGAADRLVHVIGSEGHRFYANDTWPHIHAAIQGSGS